MERGVGLELRAQAGSAVLACYGDRTPDPAWFNLSDELRAALDEWARVAEIITLGGNDQQGHPSPAELVSRRGRQLAARLAVTTGRPVGYVDPVTGAMELIGQEPTPWATGLTVSAVSAAMVLATLVALAQGLTEIGAWAPPGTLLLVTAGLAPSVWLARHTPVWRWLCFGVAAGVALSWVVLLLSLLG
ncbi:MAG TPA: DUF2537 domain-containing protein [Pseudonocardiaceae bacterium]|nr:DUF2537 domain-containing protein [Pseudonocardiaceae bacterium]